MKRIFGVEISHQKAPLAVRENISFSKDQLRGALHSLKPFADEVFIIATCNRLSVYALTDSIAPLMSFFAQFGDLTPYLSVFDNNYDAIKHLFCTASGLESQALGEHEILGQIRNDFMIAQEEGAIGPVFNEFIRKAIFTGKKVRKETAIGKYPVSLASVSYDIMKDIHKDISKTSVMVLGTGEMATLMLKLIEKRGVKNLIIASKTLERAKLLANATGGEAILMHEVAASIHQVDVIIGASHVEEHILSYTNLQTFSNSGKTLIDLGLPRNFDYKIKELDGVKLYDLDDLKSITSESMQKRQDEVPRAMGIIEEEIEEYSDWLNTREVSPIITSYFDKLSKIQEEELHWVLPKLGKLDEHQQKIIENLISRVARRVSGKPIEKLRTFATSPDMEQNPVHTFKELFDL